MGQGLLSLAGLAVTLGVLITVHEFGHFWIARRAGVKVLRFSIGFGKPLWRRVGRVDGTEYVIGAIPLGGYVKMLDTREGEVEDGDAHRAFDRQPVATRTAIVLAGPAFNFAFAILAYWLLFMGGVSALRPVLGEPLPASSAAAAGFRAGDEIVAVAGEPVRTLEEALLALLDHGVPGAAVAVQVRDADGALRTHTLVAPEAGGDDGLGHFGLVPYRPPLPAVIGSLKEGGAAQAAGLAPGDRVLAVDEVAVKDWADWAARVRAHPGQAMTVRLEREGAVRTLSLTPHAVETARGREGQIGAYAQMPSDLAESLRVVVRYGPLDAALAAVGKTWDMSAFTLRMLGRMLIGQASLDNLSGPITIAQMAGQSAAVGLSAFVSFLAVVSISLGVLNLLPVPLLDGGHLAFYLIEALKGSPLSEAAQAAGQRIGVAVLLLLMGLAFFNDLARLFGSP